MEIEKILRSQFDDVALTGLRNASTRFSGNYFFAYTIVAINDENFANLSQWFLKGRSYSYFLNISEEEKTKLSKEPLRYGGWSPHPPINISDEVANGRFSYVSVKYYGCLFEDEWYIMNDITYYELPSIEQVEENIQKNTGLDDLWQSPLFKPVPSTEKILDYESIHKNLSGSGKTMDELIRDTPYHELPHKIIPQYPNIRNFIGQPLMVAQIKQETREKLNRQYENYMNEIIFFPLVKVLKYQKPQEFLIVHSLYGMNYPLIYPHSKDYVIGVVKALNEDESFSRLYYFLYDPSCRKIYEWTRPAVRPVPGFHVFYIQEDLADLSDWGNGYDVADPSVTMDDLNFWNEYVFKKEEGKYLFLEEVDVKNNRKDIYSGF